MRVLFATDGSEFSLAALEKGCSMLRPAEALEFKIISVYEQIVPMAAEPFAVSAQYYQEMMELARKQCLGFVEDGEAIVRKAFPEARVETEVKLGAPVNVIVDEAKEWNADLILVGSHGRGFWGRLTLGSVSDAVMHHAPCSVLIAR